MNDGEKKDDRINGRCLVKMEFIGAQIIKKKPYDPCYALITTSAKLDFV